MEIVGQMKQLKIDINPSTHWAYFNAIAKIGQIKGLKDYNKESNEVSH